METPSAAIFTLIVGEGPTYVCETVTIVKSEMSKLFSHKFRDDGDGAAGGGDRVQGARDEAEGPQEEPLERRRRRLLGQRNVFVTGETCE